MEHIRDDKVNDVEFRKKVCENKEIIYESLLRKYKILKADYEKLQEKVKKYESFWDVKLTKWFNLKD
jgi:hypothetical protein